MRKFPKRFEPDVDIEVVDLDAADVEYRAEVLTETRASEVAAQVLVDTWHADRHGHRRLRLAPVARAT